MLKQLRLAPIILLLLTPLVSGFQDTPSWQLFNSAEGKFDVLVPAEPKVGVREVDSKVGKLTLYTYAASSKTAFLMVSYGDYPTAPTTAADAERVLDNVLAGVVQSIGGEKASENKIVLRGRAISGAAPIDYPGREFIITRLRDGADLVFRWRIFLVGRRLYQAAAVTTKADADSPDVLKFLSSFQIAS